MQEISSIKYDKVILEKAVRGFFFFEGAPAFYSLTNIYAKPTMALLQLTLSPIKMRK